MINAVIFSKDRALQLRLLLESLDKKAHNIFNIYIIYTYSDNSFLSGYKSLINEKIINNIFWVDQKNFKQDLLNSMNSNYEFITFFTDDDVFFNIISENEIINTINDNNDIFCFSLRLGLNTEICYTRNSINILSDYELKNNKFLIWYWQKHRLINLSDNLYKKIVYKYKNSDLNIEKSIYSDFGYPFSFDGHIFRTDEIKFLIKSLDFSNPNNLELNLHKLHYYYQFKKDKMASYVNNVLLNIPINRVQHEQENIFGKKISVSSKVLNDIYLSGKVIDYESLNFRNIISSHQEIDYIFK